MDGEKEYISLEGSVRSILYKNLENGYAVLRLTTQDGVKTVTGCLPDVSPGETLVVTGLWEKHPSYGDQFKSEFYERKLPDGEDAIYAYLSSGAIKNIGPSKARSIVDRFGNDALKVIETEPHRLAEIKGITMKRAIETGNEFRKQAGLRTLVEFLSKYGIRPHIAIRAYSIYMEYSLTAVEEDPYLLTDDRIGAEFFEADNIALSIGFEHDCEERVRAAILFEMTHNLSRGHVFIPADKLTLATDELIGVGSEAIAFALNGLTSSGAVVTEAIAGVNACYLGEMFETETLVAQKLLSLAELSSKLNTDVLKLVEKTEGKQGIKYTGEQRAAVEMAATCMVMALTGGPGTGKTTCLRGIIEVFDTLGCKTVLCAPTGRAAKRLSELSGRDASTIHRLLGAAIGEGDTLVFDHDEENPLKADAVIVDEASMIDISLMAALLRALPDNARIVFVGDADQLPPVGPGNAFSDVIKSGAVKTTVLREIFRQERTSGIVKAAHLINEGELPDLTEKYEDFFFLKRLTPEKTAETVTELCESRLPKGMNIPHAQIQVLSPTKKYESGTRALNRRLQESLNPPAPSKREKKIGDNIFRVGDKVMQTKNNYDIIWKSKDALPGGAGVFNGDVGLITDIDLSAETVTVDYDDRLVEYLFEQMYELEHAYALTVHKSQGNEYRAVVLSLSSGSPNLFTRSVLYTALTRARELLIVVGDPELFRKMIFNDRRERRYSGLRARLAGE